MAAGNKQFTIHIDKKEYKVSQSSMTGTQLRTVAQPPIGEDRDLFEEVPGPGDDKKIANDEAVEIKNGLHFYSVPKTINPGNEM